MKDGSIAKACMLLLAPVLLCLSILPCYAYTQSNMKALFNLEHDAGTVTLRPSVYADKSETLDYHIKIIKRGVNGTSTQSNGGSIEVLAGKDVEIGPVLRFGNFSSQDKLHLELKLCRQGTRCKKVADVLETFTALYPDEHDSNR